MDLRRALIEDIDESFGVYEETSFKEARFLAMLERRQIPWPRTPQGRPVLNAETFQRQVKRYPEMEPLWTLRATMSQLRKEALPVGVDHRNRCLLSAFRSKTGRNQPSSSKFIFGAPAWLRGLVMPAPGTALLYLDYEQQEFGVAAYLSGDDRMIAAYESGDPYLTFAKQAGAVPADATRQSHPKERSVFKRCALAVLFGMGAHTLAGQIGQTVAEARRLIEVHRQVYRRFWLWSDAVVDHAMLRGSLWTAFGWRLHIAAGAREPSLRNFPMQANGAEMMRLACIGLVESGIRVCAPVHDAFLIEAPLERCARVYEEAREQMRVASAAVLAGPRLRVDAWKIVPPQRLLAANVTPMWRRVWRLLEPGGAAGAQRPDQLGTPAQSTKEVSTPGGGP